MAIDMHIHISELTANNVKNVLSIIDKYEIDKALIMTITGIYSSCTDHKKENDKISLFCSLAPDRLYPSFTVNPLMGKKALNEIYRCRNDLNIKVLKLHPWTQGFSISSYEMREVARLCQQFDIAIIFHDGTPPYSTPFQIASLARDFPDLSVISGHSGLYDLWGDAIQAAKRYPNYYLTLCGPTTKAMQKILDEVPAEQICVGSDMIDIQMEDILWYRWEKFRRLRMSEEKRKTVECETPKKLLGLY